jgi:periplasmic protein TonB
MKSKTEKIPEFDEIIFRNRNKTYGAYVLRKGYKSTATLSLFFGTALFVVLVTVFSFRTDEGIAKGGPGGDVIITVDPYKPDLVDPVDTKRPEEQVVREMIRNFAPVVSTDPMTEVSMLTPEELSELDLNLPVDDPMPNIAIEPDPIVPAEPEVRFFVEEPPQFPGGESALLRYVAENLKYPEIAAGNGIQGRVYLKFVVNSDGSVNRVEVIKGVDPALDAEAKRVIGTLPRFSPGKQNGVAVPVYFTIPVLFELR